MMKLVVTLIGIFLLGFLIVNDTWSVTIIGFGYEVTSSVFLFIAAVLIVIYLLSLIRKPFGWFGGYQSWYRTRKQNQKEAYLILALKTALDRNEKNIDLLMKQRKAVFPPKSNESLMIEALFQPSPHVFEQLLHRDGTEMTGIRGLLEYAQKNGDLTEVRRLLQKAVAKVPDESWIQESLWSLQTLQSDWSDALNTLEILKKRGLIDKKTYFVRKSCLLLKLGRARDAFNLTPDNPAAAIAYTKQAPQKALSILIDSWAQTPCWETYVLFRDNIRNEKPAKQMKLVEKLVRKNKESRLSFIALAQTAMDAHMWGVAKEHMTAYFNAYPITPQTARMMAKIEREGWHHEEGAAEWEEKATTSEELGGWGCSICNHVTESWEACCPTCNTFGSIRYK